MLFLTPKCFTLINIEWANGMWQDFGFPINGTENYAELGRGLAIAPDGIRVVVGAPHYTYNPFYGYIRIYDIYPTSTEVIEVASPLRVFPNPSSGAVTVTLPDVIEGGCVVSCANTMGQVVWEEEILPLSNKQIELFLDEAGIYFLTIRQDANILQTKVVISNN